MPDQKQWGNLESILKKHTASWMIWESTPKAEIRDRLKQMGIESLVFDPCGNQPDSGDYLSVMNNNLEALIKVYTE
jgi:zinc transport system substrate-binding protein